MNLRAELASIKQRPIAVEAAYLAARYIGHGHGVHHSSTPPDTVFPESVVEAQRLIHIIEKDAGCVSKKMSALQVTYYTNNLNEFIISSVEKSPDEPKINALLARLRNYSPIPRAANTKNPKYKKKHMRASNHG